MTSDQAAAWIPIAVGVTVVLAGAIFYFVSAGTKARRDMLEQDVTDLEKRLARTERERDEAKAERDACRTELQALGRVVTAAAAIERFEQALAAHRAELMAFLERIYDLIISFRPGGRHDN